MSDRDAEVRDAAGRALEAIGHDAGKALVKASRDRDVDLRSRAALILEKVDRGDALAAYIEALKNEDAAVRGFAASSLGRFAQGPVENVVALKLIDALKDGDESVRRSAAISLGVFAYNATVIAPLVEALKDPDNKVRYSAAQSLISAHAEGKAVIPVLISALKDQDPQVRRDAVIAIGSISWEAKAAVPALIESLGDPNADVLKNAIDALGKIDTAASAGVIVPQLVRLLSRPEKGIRKAAIDALGKIDTAASAGVIVPQLVRLLSRRDKGIREAALGVLVAIGEPAAASLAKLLMGPDSSLRVKTYSALVAQGNVFAFVAALKSRDKDLRSLVLEAIEDLRVDPARGIQAPDLLFDPSRKHLFTTVRIPCTYEGDGRAIFVSELDTGTSFPILASSGGLGPSGFIEAGGRNYLVIDEGRGEATCQPGSFLLYDVKANEFIVHAEGGIVPSERGVFSYGYCGENDSITSVGAVTIKNLMNRESPLRLMPRPMHGLTLRKNTKAFNTCNQAVIIRKAGTRVLITEKREDGSYEVYYNGAIATVPKGSLRTAK